MTTPTMEARRVILLDKQHEQVTFFSDGIDGREFDVQDIGMQDIEICRFVLDKGVKEGYKALDESYFVTAVRYVGGLT